MKKILLGLVTAILGLSLVGAPVFAKCSDEQLEKGCVDTAILGKDGCSCTGAEPGEDGGIRSILYTVIDIMTVGIGILGVIGIIWVGIQYLTAGGSEEKTRQAKRRMFEIVIGLIAYALMYAFLRWLLPKFGGTP